MPISLFEDSSADKGGLEMIFIASFFLFVASMIVNIIA